jgi:ribosome-binding protein aMBF1 (putative translation factor)
MSKFLLTGCLIVLLASFLNYPTESLSSKKQQKRATTVIFPISEQVKLARMEKNMSKKDLAQKVGLSRMSLERIEKGQLVPNREVLQKLSSELSVGLTLSGY